MEHIVVICETDIA